MTEDNFLFSLNCVANSCADLVLLRPPPPSPVNRIIQQEACVIVSERHQHIPSPPIIQGGSRFHRHPLPPPPPPPMCPTDNDYKKAKETVERTMLYKTRRCKTWVNGYCKYGRKCRFVHPYETARPRPFNIQRLIENEAWRLFYYRVRVKHV